jgi:hypothetical protein
MNDKPVTEPIEDPEKMKAALRHYLDEWNAAYAAKFPEQHKRLRGWRIDFRIQGPPDLKEEAEGSQDS